MRFAREMAFYSAYHQEKRNVWIHVLGVPTISFSLLLVLSWVPLFSIEGFQVTLAMAAAVLVLGYYFTLDFIFSSVATILFGTILYFANSLSTTLDSTTVWSIFAGGQILGWGTQIYGHYVFEKSRPAFLDNLFQALVSAPLFVVADVFFELGLRKNLEEDIKAILKERGVYKSFSKSVA
ncbi:MAG: DUF962 domain-containing protein [Leptospira sp.]|nr:DUF962 domain-containing protein [Leptospira sp.]NCS92915.1 DUF962 domain-containing protein [Leptospira sp.]